ncbi:hypothetical protein [Hyunsoonleella rubra]|uniref:Fibronectin type-III domain-containing protein n=1 Tax=Hyunsoonleella rubra TaxID=1737062 RepID=A0ABW5TDV9_9FLAO
MRRLIYIFYLGVLLFGCSKSSNNDGGGEDPNNQGGPNQSNPLIVNLQFPHEDGLCNVGTDITPTQSTVVFEWEASTTAESYTIFVSNLINGAEIQETTNQDKIGITLDRATPYSWYVESTAGSKTEKSETWKFYNAGPGVETYAPFPATLDSPSMAASVNGPNVTLQWTGSDVDNDISGYDVYFGTVNPPNLHASDVATTQQSVSVTSGSIYYWKIVTKDVVGNASHSDTFQFRAL